MHYPLDVEQQFFCRSTHGHQDMDLGTGYPKDIAIIGAGIIGLSIAFQAVKAGANVTVVDRDPEGDKVSFGNAGGIAFTEVVPVSVPGLWKKVPGWLVDPLGPLSVRIAHAPRLAPWLIDFARAGSPSEMQRISAALASLNRRTYDDLVPMLDEVGLGGELSRTGALTVYETESGLVRDRVEWDLRRRHGIDIQELSGDEARDLEPTLSSIVKAGVFTPQWSQVSDPKRIVDGLRRWLAARGVSFVRGDVTAVLPTHDMVTLRLHGDTRLRAHKVVVAAGVWSKQLARQLGDRVLVESERGYNTTIADPPIALRREVIFADRKFVATPLACGLRIGGAAEFGGVKAKPNFERSRALVKLAGLYFPQLGQCEGVEWSGHRPTTPDSLPVIGPSASSTKVIYAFGHGHLGLTQAATTAKLVGEMLMGRRPSIDPAPFSVSRFTLQPGGILNGTPDLFLH